MNAVALQTTPAVRAYLRRATWGLPKERQQEIWDELEEHLLTRAAQLQACGVAPSEALASALAELGSPTRISAGMTGVYLMPKLILMVGAGALALSAALYALAGGEKAITLPIHKHLPVPVCKNIRPDQVTGTIVSNWMDVVCYFPAPPTQAMQSGGSAGFSIFVDQRTVETMITALNGTTQLNSNGVLEISFPDALQSKIEWPVTTQLEGQNYFPARILIQNQAPIPQTLSGYAQPLIHVGHKLSAVGDGTDAQVGPDFYNSIAQDLIGLIEPGVIATEAYTGARTHNIQTSLKAGEVVVAITHSYDDAYLMTFAPVDTQSIAAIRVNPAKISIVSNFNQLRQPTSDNSTPALIVRVTNIPLNNLKSGILTPEQVMPSTQ